MEDLTKFFFTIYIILSLIIIYGLVTRFPWGLRVASTLLMIYVVTAVFMMISYLCRW